MSEPQPHPFEQMPTDHVGWNRKHFEYAGHNYSLLVIDTLKADLTGKMSSMISMLDSGVMKGPWKSHHHLTVPCRLTVDAAVRIIDQMSHVYRDGTWEGAEEARAAVRKAIGAAAS